MNFRANGTKLFASIIVLALWWFILSKFSVAVCILPPGGLGCSDYENVYERISLLPEDPCSCTSFGKALWQDFLIFIPAILTYFVWSLSQRKTA